MSNEGEFPWSWLQWGPHLILERERKKYVVACWRPPKKLEIRRRSLAGTAKKCPKKTWCTCRVVDLLNNPIAFLKFFVAVAVVVTKALYYPTQGYNNRSTAQLVQMDKQRLFFFLLYAYYTIKRPLTCVIANLSVSLCVKPAIKTFLWCLG